MPSSIRVNVQLRTAEAIAGIQNVAWQAAKDTVADIEKDIKGDGPNSIALSVKDEQGRFVPSESGEPPHLRTGNLRRSYHPDLDEANRIARFGSDPSIAPYAPFVELGTRFMAARPHLVPATERQRPLVAKRMADGLTAYFKTLPRMGR